MRKNIAAGNWKMNLDLDESIKLAQEVSAIDVPNDTEVILAVPFPFLFSCHLQTQSNPKVFLAAQNCNENASGAFTGEVSLSQLKSVGVEYIIIGHSERRQFFAETDQWLAKKVDAALENGLKVIFCCGESLEVREAESHLTFVENQLEKGVFHISAEQLQNVVLAYEPIWAIGTGKTASPQQAQDMHGHIRNSLELKYGKTAAQNVSILYGGSVKPTNAKELFANEDVDGGLVGGASLKSDTFIPIIKSFA